MSMHNANNSSWVSAGVNAGATASVLDSGLVVAATETKGMPYCIRLSKEQQPPMLEGVPLSFTFNIREIKGSLSIGFATKSFHLGSGDSSHKGMFYNNGDIGNGTDVMLHREEKPIRKGDSVGVQVTNYNDEAVVTFSLNGETIQFPDVFGYWSYGEGELAKRAFYPCIITTGSVAFEYMDGADIPDDFVDPGKSGDWTVESLVKNGVPVKLSIGRSTIPLTVKGDPTPKTIEFSCGNDISVEIKSAHLGGLMVGDNYDIECVECARKQTGAMPKVHTVENALVDAMCRMNRLLVGKKRLEMGGVTEEGETLHLLAARNFHEEREIV